MNMEILIFSFAQATSLLTDFFLKNYTIGSIYAYILMLITFSHS